MDFSRRQFLYAAGATSLAGGKLRAQEAASLAALLDQIANDALDRQPEARSALGLDTGTYRQARHRLDSRGFLERHRMVSDARRFLESLRRVDQARLTPGEKLLFESVRQQLESAASGAPFEFGNAGRFGGGTPYVVSQQDGSYQRIPVFLDTVHAISVADDAEAYLDRLRSFGRVLDEETSRLGLDAGQGVIPPAFIADKAIRAIEAALRIPADQSRLVSSLARRAGAAGIEGAWSKRAEAIAAKEIYPALARQLKQLQRNRAAAGDQAGVWRLPAGDAYYSWLLEYSTTTRLTPTEIHQMGLDQGAELDSRLDAAFKSLGMAGGSVGERLSALNSDPAETFANTDQGRKQLLGFVEERVARLRQMMPRVSALGIDVPITVQRVPSEIQDGAPLAYLNPGALDGSRPSIYYLNLKDTTNWPRFTLSTLCAHEGVPGHAWQAAYAIHSAAQKPMILNLLGFNAYTEGWGLYAEQLADELGLYDGDPKGRIGMLQALRLRASRLAADTGIHVLRWSREKAVDFFVTTTGRPRDVCISEIDRYCAAPGQACGYKVGHSELLRLRENWQRRLGSRFDIRLFNDAVIEAGAMPLTILPDAIAQRLGPAGQRSDNHALTAPVRG